MNLRTARLQADLTVSEVARQLGVSRQTIHSWENGRHRMTINTLMKLADLYGIHPTELLPKVKG